MNMKQNKPIELYYWPTPNGWKVSIMLEECNIPYILKPVNIGQGDQFKPKFLKISPNNRMPAIIDPYGPGGKSISIFESGAILQYLGRKSGKFYPKNERSRVKVDEWIYWQMCGLGPMAGQAHHFRQYAPMKIKYAIKRYTDEVNRLYGVMDRQLKNNEYLAGRYSIADIANWCWTRTHKWSGISVEGLDNLARWNDAMYKQPGMLEGIKVPVSVDNILNDDKKMKDFADRARKNLQT